MVDGRLVSQPDVWMCIIQEQERGGVRNTVSNVP